MNFIVIETSLEKSFVLLSVGQAFSCSYLPDRSQQAHLIPVIKTLLQKANLSLKELDFISVGQGPGPSFTGTRVGVCLAKTLAFAQRIPLVPFVSPVAYHPAVSEFLLLIDGKSRGFYGYDGQRVTLIPSLSDLKPSSTPLYSLKQLSIFTLLAPLNIPFLLDHLKKAFLEGKITSPSQFSIND